ncbi:LPXTG cell wall anchor domain-containing protein [Streptomyces spectabilis]|uniref:LPXTG cell wall anchor domain-containing protein n=1 Tax=Streptomyces spectabilis TaxID=68270 RepID=UPI0033DB8A6E
MSRVRATFVGALLLAAASVAVPGAAADAGGSGELTVEPGAARPGERVALSLVNPELDEGARVRSEVFEKSVELKSTGKVSFAAHARIRCDAEPGTYAVHFAEPVHPGESTRAGEVTVEKGDPIDGRQCAAQAKAKAAADGDRDGDGDGKGTTALAVAGGAVAVVAGGAFLVVLRRRRS